ncbi:MAG: tyrosine-type recombinase/integrase, partial [Candidatus Zixiibacteriota bacterium]
GLTFVSNDIEPFFWKGTNSVRKILKSRAAEAGVKYYHPHSFRHSAAYLALKYCRNGEELKAISQNFSHEHLRTTMMSYGNLDDRHVGEVIREMNFAGTETKSESSILAELEKLIKKYPK